MKKLPLNVHVKKLHVHIDVVVNHEHLDGNQDKHELLKKLNLKWNSNR